MKKLLTTFLLLLSISIFSQTYYFDYYLNYKSELTRDHNTIKRNYQFLVNSKIHDYEMRFDFADKKMTATIADYNNEIRHYFVVKNVTFPLKNDAFEYLYSIKMQGIKKQFEEEFNRRFFSAELISQKYGLFEYSVKGYNNKKMKGATSKAKVEFAKFDTDLSSFILNKLFDYYEIHRKLDFKENYIVKSATNKFDDATVSFQLEAVEPQNLNLTISPNQIKFK